MNYKDVKRIPNLNKMTTIPPTDYQILVNQSFRCKGVHDYVCPMLMRTFDRSGYSITTIGTKKVALCPACYAVSRQNKTTQHPTNDAHIQAKQRIIHFLHNHKWTIGNGEYRISFNGFWQAFYNWSKNERMFTKKTLVRSIITNMCKVPHDATHLPINPI